MSKESRPPAGMEDRVVHALRSRGYISKSTTRWTHIAAAIVLLLLGFAAGRWQPSRGADQKTPRFVLFLYGSEGSTGSVAEHKAWASEWAKRGKLAGGEKLTQEARQAGIDDVIPIVDPVGGFFVIQTADWPEAMAIARTCPHAQHGGRIVVRRIDHV